MSGFKIPWSEILIAKLISFVSAWSKALSPQTPWPPSFGFGSRLCRSLPPAGTLRPKREARKRYRGSRQAIARRIAEAHSVTREILEELSTQTNDDFLSGADQS
jgi:hypothetical protein